MNRDKQIKEIAAIITKSKSIGVLELERTDTDLAEEIYDADYRKQSEGEWKYDEDCECFVCSVCEHSALNNYRLLSTPSNYCPNCGAKMKGGE